MLGPVLWTAATTPLTEAVTAAIVDPASEIEPLTATVAALVELPEAGELMSTTGGVESRVTSRTTVVEWPRASVAITVIAFAPSASPRSHVNVAPERGAVTVVAPSRHWTRGFGSASDTVPVTTTLGDETMAPCGGSATTSAGGVVSTENEAEDEPTFPAWSWIVAVRVWTPSARAEVAGTSASAWEAPAENSGVTTTPSRLHRQRARAHARSGRLPRAGRVGVGHLKVGRRRSDGGAGDRLRDGDLGGRLVSRLAAEIDVEIRPGGALQVDGEGGRGREAHVAVEAVDLLVEVGGPGDL